MCEKRLSDNDKIRNASIVLLDIEGTTTSIAFVKDVLFQYVRKNLANYVRDSWNDNEFKADLELLKEQANQDEKEATEGFVNITLSEDVDASVNSVVQNVLWQMDLDRKTKALKQLQGHIWRHGYKNGALKGHLFSDVVPALKSWIENGRQIYVYSSGSVEAQKLLFGHSEQGDVLQLFSGHFDTDVGLKTEPSSYANIINKLGCKSDDVLFLTDVVKEAEAAVCAGLGVLLVCREGNDPVSDEDKSKFSAIKTFQDVVFEMPSKRLKLSPESCQVQEAAAELETKGNDKGLPMCDTDVEMTDVSVPNSCTPENNENQNIKTDVSENMDEDSSDKAEKCNSSTAVNNGTGSEHEIQNNADLAKEESLENKQLIVPDASNETVSKKCINEEKKGTLSSEVSNLESNTIDQSNLHKEPLENICKSQDLNVNNSLSNSSLDQDITAEANRTSAVEANGVENQVDENKHNTKENQVGELQQETDKEESASILNHVNVEVLAKEKSKQDTAVTELDTTDTALQDSNTNTQSEESQNSKVEVDNTDAVTSQQEISTVKASEHSTVTEKPAVDSEKINSVEQSTVVLAEQNPVYENSTELARQVVVESEKSPGDKDTKDGTNAKEEQGLLNVKEAKTKDEALGTDINQKSSEILETGTQQGVESVSIVSKENQMENVNYKSEQTREVSMEQPMEINTEHKSKTSENQTLETKVDQTSIDMKMEIDSADVIQLKFSDTEAPEPAVARVKQNSQHIVLEDSSERIAENVKDKLKPSMDTHNVVGEEQSSTVARDHSSTAATENQSSTDESKEEQVTSEEQSSTVAAEEQTSTVAAEEQTSTVAAEEQTSTVVAEEQTSTVAAEEQTSTVAAEEQTSTVAAEEQTSTVAAEDQTSTVAAEDQTSTGATEDQQSSTSASEEQQSSTAAAEEQPSTVATEEQPSIATAEKEQSSIATAEKKQSSTATAEKEQSSTATAEKEQSSTATANMHVCTPVIVESAASAVEVESSSSAMEVESSASAMEVESSASAMEVESSASAMEVESSASVIKVESSTSVIKVESSASAMEVESSSSAIAMEVEGSASVADKQVLSDAASEEKHVSNDAASEEKHVSNDAASEDKQVSSDAASEEKHVSNDAASEEKQMSRDAASEDKQVSSDAAAENKQVSSDAATEDKQVSSDAAAENKQVSSNAPAEKKHIRSDAIAEEKQVCSDAIAEEKQVTSDAASEEKQVSGDGGSKEKQQLTMEQGTVVTCEALETEMEVSLQTVIKPKSDEREVSKPVDFNVSGESFKTADIVTSERKPDHSNMEIKGSVDTKIEKFPSVEQSETEVSESSKNEDNVMEVQEGSVEIPIVSQSASDKKTEISDVDVGKDFTKEKMQDKSTNIEAMMKSHAETKAGPSTVNIEETPPTVNETLEKDTEPELVNKEQSMITNVCKEPSTAKENKTPDLKEDLDAEEEKLNRITQEEKSAQVVMEAEEVPLQMEACQEIDQQEVKSSSTLQNSANSVESDSKESDVSANILTSQEVAMEVDNESGLTSEKKCTNEDFVNKMSTQGKSDDEVKEAEKDVVNKDGDKNDVSKQHTYDKAGPLVKSGNNENSVSSEFKNENCGESKSEVIENGVPVDKKLEIESETNETATKQSSNDGAITGVTESDLSSDTKDILKEKAASEELMDVDIDTSVTESSISNKNETELMETESCKEMKTEANETDDVDNSEVKTGSVAENNREMETDSKPKKLTESDMETECEQNNFEQQNGDSIGNEAGPPHTCQCKNIIDEEANMRAPCTCC